MVIILKKPWEVSESEVTPENIFHQRRKFMQAGTALGTALLLSPWKNVAASMEIGSYKRNVITLDEEITKEQDVASYNNFYEFGTGKEDPARRAKKFNTSDWKITVGGECNKPGEYALEDLVDSNAIEERIYRLRCVEAWSMVIPWLGIPLASVINKLEPSSNAKYVAFKTLHDPRQMPGQNRSILQWPYREGLRIDEAMNPLTLLSVGMYGKTMPNQNGAPVRLVVPWKYGFKSIKSIVSIDFTEEQPPTSWNMSSGREYGFYSNVNPEVNHPRWSQKKERRIGDLFKRETMMFNGYEEEVAGMYDGMDLRANY
ncbi:MAG: protein-methionine-sulfoxide reductase catalytic subunit MsrP [Gammaproteobacteria bacterium]|nr:protein-methionine-sulfoxide reductase catalytic subunit MsrP [Gammaproteobacteria bacterium]